MSTSEGSTADPSPSSPSNNTTKRRWFPLESNPALLNAYAAKLGFDTNLYEFVDVFSTESWALEMIPKPVAAVIMLYPLSPVQEAHREAERATHAQTAADTSDQVWYMKQLIGNACGTIGILHALANVSDNVRAAAVRSDSWLGRYYDRCPAGLDPTQKADVLERDGDIDKMHDDATSDPSNQTSRGNLEDQVETHFIALVHVDGGLYELDGRKAGPIRHGNTSEANLLQDACRVVESFMKRDPEEVRFTILALAPKGKD